MWNLVYDLWIETSWSLVSNGSNSKSFGVPTESYGDFSGQWSAEKVLFRILFLLYVFITNFKSHV
jgi:hypothetical protein